MSYSEALQDVTVSTNAGFRAWGLAVRTAILAAGLTRTSDTGQIDFTSVAAPATSAYGGYDIFQFTDAEQATDPIYIKLEYGRGSTGERHALRMAVGTATNGAGTLTNSSGQKGGAATGSPSGKGNIFASFFEGCFVVTDDGVPSSNAAANKVVLGVERLRSPTTGAIVTNGIGILGQIGGTTDLDIRLSGSWTTGTANLGGSPTPWRGRTTVGVLRYPQYPGVFRGIVMLHGGFVQYALEHAIQLDIANGISARYRRLRTQSQYSTSSLALFPLVRVA